jgi:hypothetical protein
MRCRWWVIALLLRVVASGLVVLLAYVKVGHGAIRATSVPNLHTVS